MENINGNILNLLSKSNCNKFDSIKNEELDYFNYESKELFLKIILILKSRKQPLDTFLDYLKIKRNSLQEKNIENIKVSIQNNNKFENKINETIKSFLEETEGAGGDNAKYYL